MAYEALDALTRRALIKQVTRHEGRRFKPYDDATGVTLRQGRNFKGNITIGVGRNLSTVGLRPKEIDMLLENDLLRVAKSLHINKRYGDTFKRLGRVRKQVLVNMAFNLGVHGLYHFKTLWLALEQSDFELAASEMLSSKWATQVGVQKPNKKFPLGGRAYELADMMETGMKPYTTLKM